MQEIIEKAIDDAWMEQPLNVTYAAQKVIEALTLPTVKLKCGKCGGSGKIKDKCHHAIKTQKAACTGNSCSIARDCECDFDGMIYFVCPACTNGEREYRIVWEDRQCAILSPQCGLCNMLEKECSGGWITKPLTYIDLGDPDVAVTYHTLMHDKDMAPWDIPHNKGTLRLIEKGG